MKKKIVSILGIIVVVIILLIITIYNVLRNNDFWSVSVYQIISLSFAIFITYLLTQKKNEIRRKKEMLDKMIEGIQKDISEKELVMYYATEGERAVALLQQKSLANRLEYLKNASVCVDIYEEVKYLSEEMEHLREFYGAHMTDKEYLEKSSMDIKKYIVNITDKCFSIRLKLYEI